MATRKIATLDQINRMQARAVMAAENLQDDPDRADELESMSPEEYAESKNIQITNPAKRRTLMTRADAEARITELEEENEELRDSLSEIKGIVSSSIDDDDEFDDDGEDE